MYSSTLAKSGFLALQQEFKGVRADLHDAAKAINQYFITLRKRIGDRPMLVEPELPEALLALLDGFLAGAEKELAASGEPHEPTAAGDLFRSPQFRSYCQVVR